MFLKREILPYFVRLYLCTKENEALNKALLELILHMLYRPIDGVTVKYNHAILESKPKRFKRY